MRKITLVAATLAFALWSAASVVHGQTDARARAFAMAQEGRDSAHAGKYDEALKLFAAALKFDPDNLDYMYGLARAAHLAGVLVLAEASYLHFLTLAPKHRKADSARAYLATLIVKRRAATTTADDRNDAQAMAQRAHEAFTQGQFDLAVERLTAAVKDDPGSLAYQFGLARAMQLAGGMAVAEALYRQLLTAVLDDRTARLARTNLASLVGARGATALAAGALDLALTASVEAASLEPANPRWPTQVAAVADAALAKRQAEIALRAANAVRAMEPKVAAHGLRQARALHMAGDASALQRYHEELQAKAPANSEAVPEGGGLVTGLQTGAVAPAHPVPSGERSDERLAPKPPSAMVGPPRIGTVAPGSLAKASPVDVVVPANTPGAWRKTAGVTALAVGVVGAGVGAALWQGSVEDYAALDSALADRDGDGAIDTDVPPRFGPSVVEVCPTLPAPSRRAPLPG